MPSMNNSRPARSFRRLAACGAMLIVAATTSVVLAKIAAPRPGPLAANGGRLVVEEKPRYPNEVLRPNASTPVTEKGLTLTVRPEKNSFPSNGPLSFEVTLKNTSEKPFVLCGVENLGADPQLVLVNAGNAAQWTVPRGPVGPAKAGVTLAPGKSLTYYAVVEGTVTVQPQPVPFPQPRPVPLPRPILQPAQPEAIQPRRGELKGAAAAPEPGAPRLKDDVGPNPGVIRRPPIIIAPPVATTLPVGTGKCRGKLLLEFAADATRKYNDPVWTGKLASDTFEFTVSELAGPVPPVVIQPPVIGPGNEKSRAIALAAQAAEAALSSSYTSIDGVRPPHVGNWIDQPEKTAKVEEKKGTGWVVSWTHVPLKGGFSYNVTVDVDLNGGVNVREVFPGYSPPR